MGALLPGTDTSADALRDLRTALARAGAVRVQHNVDDDAVADAPLRLSRHDEPIRSIVSVWTTDADACAAVLAPLADVWLVEEKRRTEPPTAPDGNVEDWLANVALLHRPDDMPHEAWLSHWMDVHTTVAIETQDTYGYVQNIVLETLTDHPGRDAEFVDGIVEELFLMGAKHDPHVFYGSSGDDAELRRRIEVLMESCSAFGANRDLALVPSRRSVHDLT